MSGLPSRNPKCQALYNRTQNLISERSGTFPTSLGKVNNQKLVQDCEITSIFNHFCLTHSTIWGYQFICSKAKDDCCCCCCCVASVVSDSVRPHRWKPTRLPRPWDSPGKNTGVGCHFLLQYVKVKSKREVTQLCPTLSDPMDCSLPGSSAHGTLQARVLEWGAIAFSVKDDRTL